MKNTNENEKVDKQTDDKADWFLQSFVTMFNENNGSMGLTLVTHGFLVSGQLIGGKEYFEGFGDDLASAIPNGGDKIKQTYKEMGEKVYNREKEGNSHAPTFIHLKNAKFFHPNGQPIPTNRGVLWRGRISEISGFSLGQLSTPD